MALKAHQPVRGMVAGAVVVGVDVGGPKKGFHAVALRSKKIVGIFTTPDAAAVAEWCHALHAAAVAVDAPCRWSRTKGGRMCERELARACLASFATPTVAVGRRHPFYAWMLNGVELFRRLTPRYPLYDGRCPPVSPLCIETFPHAIACALAGRVLAAKQKVVDRRRVLQDAGVEANALRNLDEVDAALCALAAHHLLAGSFAAYGDETGGMIVVPTREDPSSPAGLSGSCGRSGVHCSPSA